MNRHHHSISSKTVDVEAWCPESLTTSNLQKDDWLCYTRRDPEINSCLANGLYNLCDYYLLTADSVLRTGFSPEENLESLSIVSAGESVSSHQ